ncbi:ethanolamine ammonia-lyase reactivating factor EutA [Candidatus Lokiarchaeum ossiferum]|uniref:ethanolamine ammonia-lyase reactivating factor EutA n=1 Tax=Candidatus Lokiarchaeum ossiferum TaxID=2951803 RepID=UPI00352F532E
MEKNKKKAKSAKQRLSLTKAKAQIISIVERTLKERFPENLEVLMQQFRIQYEILLKKYEVEDNNELLRYYRITSQYKLALAHVSNLEEYLDELCEQVDARFDETHKEEHNQTEIEVPKKRAEVEFKYYCTICHQSFDIPSEMKAKLENSPEKVVLPKHHEKEMILKIFQDDSKDKILPMGKKQSTNHLFSKTDGSPKPQKNQTADTLQMLSVGIDIGSSTSHLIFSHLTLHREFSFLNKTNRFKLVDRKIIYEGEIIFTPLRDDEYIDIEKLVEFFKKEYIKAKITPEMVDTGAVIVTGESAKKKNAAEIVEKIASESGKFVSASAGPNFESTLGIMGSGMLEESKRLTSTIMNVDIGGGTSNIAIASNGNILSTSCINVGGRLLGIDKYFKIWRIDEPTEWIFKELALNYQLGDIISQMDILRVVKVYANALLEVMQGPARSSIARKLMMTENIQIPTPVHKYSFSGGVAELIYSTKNSQLSPNISGILNPFDDIGIYLAIEIRNLCEELQLPIIEPTSKIRATVIGAGAFSLSVSGSTCYWDETIKLPLNNIPVVPIAVDYNKFFFEGYQEYLRQKVEIALRNFNLVEGEDVFALYFKDQIYQSAIVPLAQSLEIVFSNSINNHKLIIIVLGEDGGKMLGLTLKRETLIKNNLLCLDELDLEAGDWIDIGAPLNTGAKKSFPITKKSLVFNSNKN